MLKVHLEPEQATAVPGTALTLTAVVTNEGSVQRTCLVRVVGLEAPWVEHSAGELTVPAGSRLEVPIRVTLPHGFPRGETLVGIEVQPDGDERPILADISLSVSDLESLSIGLSPVTVRGGWRGRFRLNVQNRGTEPLTIKLTGRGVGPDDTKSDLEFTFRPQELTLRPGERVKTRGFVSGKRHVFGAPKRRALTVTAQGQTAPRHVQGAFVQRPLMPKNVLRLVGLVLILAMWAGALTTGVRLTSKSAKSQSAQDASAIGPAGAAGAAGAGGAGGAGADGNGTGSEKTLVPATGGSIAGQVKGPQDASGVNVSLRAVALADNLADDATLISASTEPAKESAQTLRREPAGPVGPTAKTVTDADGRWAFGGLRSPANYELTFAKAGFTERTYIVTVNDQTPIVALDVPLATGNGAIAGTIASPDGPLGGADVTVTDGTVTFRTTTPTEGEVGTWSVDGLTTPGTYVVTATHRGYGTETTSLALGSGDTKSGVDLTMAPGVGSISGHITGAGSKLGNITVTATAGKVTRTASTLTEGDAGSYSLPQLPIPGDYTITVAGDGWIPQTLLLALKGNASKVDIDLVRTTATIVGTVKDTTGKSLASTGVTLAQDKPIVKTLSAIDPAGSYELTGLTPGTYTLSFDRADFKSESAIVTVAAGERRTLDMALSAQVGDKIAKDAIVRGIVRSSTTGNPAAGVQVTTNATTVTTDATGGFVFDKLAPGSYDLAFAQATFQPTTRTVRIGAKSDTTIDVTMLPLGGIQGVVSDLTATPINSVTVTVTNDPAATGQPAFTMATSTNASGQYSLLEQLKTGKYIATFTKAGYETRTRNFDAAAGTVVTGDTTLIELGAIFGTIQEPNSAVSGGFVPLNTDGAGAVTVTVTNLGSGTVQTLSNQSAEYHVIGLTPGNYRVDVAKPGYQLASKTLNDIKLREVRDGSVVLNGTPQTISGTVTYRDANGVDTPLVGATVTATIVTGFNTLTVFPFIQPRTATRVLTTGALGAWTIPALVGGVDNGPIAGTSGSYVASMTGFTTRSVAVTVPDINHDGDIIVTAIPRDVSGRIKISSAVTAGSTTVNVALTGGNLVVARNLTPSVANDGTYATYTYTTPSVPVGSYTLTFTASGFNTVSVPIAVTAATGTFTVPDQTISKLGSLAVTVSSGAALSGVSVTLNPGGTVQTTNSSGLATFNNVVPGNYTLDLAKAGYEPIVGQAVTIGAGQAQTATPTMAKWSTLLLHLRSKLDSATPALTGATVNLIAFDSFGNPASTTPIPEVSATPGDYTIASLAPGNYDITASATGHPNTITRSISTSAGTDLTGAAAITVDVPANPKLRLTLKGHQAGVSPDPVLSGATVSASTGAVPMPEVGTTGDYLSASVAVGTYRIDALKTGYTADFVAGVSAQPGLTATPTLVLNKWPKLTVRVNSHVATPGDTAFGAGATLTATPLVAPGGAGTGAAAVTLAATDVNGDSVNTTLPPGPYRLNVHGGGHTDNNTVEVNFAAGDADVTTSVRLEKWPAVKVRVISHTANNGDPAIGAGAHLSATPLVIGTGLPTGGPDVALSDTDVNGDSVTSNVPPGRYLLNVNKIGHDPNNTVEFTTVAGANPGNPTQTVILNKLATVTVRVNGHTTGVNPDTAVGSGATLTATPLVAPGGAGTGAAAVPLVATDGNGDSINVNLTPGAYRLNVHKTGYDDNNTVGFNFVAGDDDVQVPVVLQRWPAVTIRVNEHTAAGGNTTIGAGATVTATPLDATSGLPTGGLDVPLATTDSNGDSTNPAPALPPGRYRLNVHKAGHDDNTFDLTFAAGDAPGAPTATVNLEKHATLNVTPTGRVTVNGTDTDSGITNALVVATETTTLTTVSLVQGSTPGTYSSSAVSPGTYDIKIDAPGYTTRTILGSVVGAVGAGATKSYAATAGAGITVTANAILPAVSGTITGFVRKLDGSALGGVTITAQSNGSVTSTVSEDGTAGTTLGRYTITARAPVTWTVTYQLSGYSTLTQQVTVPKGSVANAGGTANVDAVIVALGGTVTGKTFGQPTTAVAVNAGYNPQTALAGVSVHLTGTNVTVDRIQTVSSDGSGNFAYGFADLPVGNYDILFSVTGYQDRTVSFHVDVAQVISRQDTLDQVMGTASVNVTGTGVTGPVQSVAFRLSGPLLTGSQLNTFSSNAAGAATSPSVPPGSYTLVVDSAPAGWFSDGNGTVAPIVVPSGGVSTTRNLTVAAVGTISGTTSINDNGGAVPANGVSVALTAAGFTQRDTVSSSSAGTGSYAFLNVPIGTYTVTYTSTGRISDTDVAVVVTQAGTATADGTVVGQSTISGTVSHHDGTSSSALTGADIALSGIGFTTVHQTSGALGAYTFSNVPAGSYTLTFTDTSRRTVTTNNVAVTHGVPVTGQNALLYDEGILSGTVQQDPGTGPVNSGSVTVTAVGPETKSTTTAAGGTYSIGSLRAGTYTVTYSKSPYTDGSTSAVIAYNATTTKDITLYGVGDLSGLASLTDTSAPAAPAGGITVTVTGTPPGSPAVNQSTTSASAGTVGAYSFTSLPAGSYTVTFTKAGYTTAVQTLVVVTPGGSTTRNGSISLLSTLTVTISNGGTIDADGQTMTLTGSDGAHPAVISAGTHAASFTGLTPGIVYRVTVGGSHVVKASTQDLNALDPGANVGQTIQLTS